MIDLIKLNENKYVVSYPSERLKVRGDYDKAVDVLRFLNVEDGEIDQAMSEFEDQGHNRANFGINRSLVFTEFTEEATV